MKPHKFLYLLIAFTFLAGCAQLTPAHMVTLTIPATETQTLAPLTPTETPTKTPTKTSTPTLIPSEIREYCPEISTQVESSLPSNGTIVLTGKDFSFQGEEYTTQESETATLLFWNASVKETHTRLFKDMYTHFYFVTSPDKHFLAFTEGKTLAMDTDAFVYSSNGDEVAKFSLPDDWALVNWVNNSQLAVRQFLDPHPDSEFDMVSINPFTGERRFLPSNYPELDTRSTYWWGSLIIYDPTLSTAAYMGGKGKDWGSAVWDIRNEKQIMRINKGNWPTWSPDGEQLIIIGPSLDGTSVANEIFLISQNGDVERLTFFENHIETAIINLPVWSSDGRYVAFLLSTEYPIKSAKLAILDTVAAKVDLYCMEVNPFPERFGDYLSLGSSYFQVNSAAPIWSPDSQQVLIDDRDVSTGVDDTYLIDIQDHTITLLVKNARPVSWMK